MDNSLSFVPVKNQKVYFGRSRGEQTLGEVVLVNRSRAKVRQLESRGTLKAHKVGTIWTVPFNLLTPAPANAMPVDGTPEAAPAPSPLPKRAESEIMRDILGVYVGLSPENLSCD